MNKRKLTALSTAIGLAMGAGISKVQYKTAGQSISARHTSDQTACAAMAGNRKDVCMAEANGRESVAKAELELNYGDSNEHRTDVRIAKANAAYAIAKEKCDLLATAAKATCIQEAKAVHGQS